MEPEILKRYEALDDQGKRLCHEIGQLVLDAVAPRDRRIKELEEIVRRLTERLEITTDEECHPDCLTNIHDGEDCDCGYVENHDALAEAREALSSEGGGE